MFSVSFQGNLNKVVSEIIAVSVCPGTAAHDKDVVQLERGD